MRPPKSSRRESRVAPYQFQRSAPPPPPEEAAREDRRSYAPPPSDDDSALEETKRAAAMIKSVPAFLDPKISDKVYGGPMKTLHPSEAAFWLRRTQNATNPLNSIDEAYLFSTSEVFRGYVTNVIEASLEGHYDSQVPRTGPSQADTPSVMLVRRLAVSLARLAVITASQPLRFTLEMKVLRPRDDFVRVTARITSREDSRCFLQTIQKFSGEIKALAEHSSGDPPRARTSLTLRVSFPEVPQSLGATSLELSAVLRVIPSEPAKNQAPFIMREQWLRGPSLPSGTSFSLTCLSDMQSAAKNIVECINLNDRSTIFEETSSMPVECRGSAEEGLAFDCLLTPVYAIGAESLVAIKRILTSHGFAGFLIETHVTVSPKLGVADVPGLLIHCPIRDRGAQV